MFHLLSLIILFIFFGVIFGVDGKDSMDFVLSENLMEKRDEPTIRRNGAYIWKRDYDGLQRMDSWKKRSMNEMTDNGKRSNDPPVRRIVQYIWKRSNGMKKK